MEKEYIAPARPSMAPEKSIGSPYFDNIAKGFPFVEIIKAIPNEINVKKPLQKPAVKPTAPDFANSNESKAYMETPIKDTIDPLSCLSNISTRLFMFRYMAGVTPAITIDIKVL